MRPVHLRILLFLVLLGAARGQSIHWDPPGGPIAVGQTTQLQLVCAECEPRETPVPPKIAGLMMQFAGQSSNMAIVNGSYSQSLTYTYAALLTVKQALDIPSFEIETNRGRVRVPAAHFDPASATVGNTGKPLESAAHSNLEVSPESVWAGQVFELKYAVQAAHGYYPDFGRRTFEWTSDPLVAEDWSAGEPFELNASGEAQSGLAYRTRALAPKAGDYRLTPINQLVNLSVGVTGFGFFQQRQYQTFSVPSNAPQVHVRPLPAPPPGFDGAVGGFKLESKVVPETAAVGEPVTWTLQLSGTGNWPQITGLPPRTVSRDFHVVHPQIKHTPVAGKIFDASLSEDAILVPTKAGRYALPSMRFVYFDPAAGTYRTLVTPQTSLTITPAAANLAAPGERSAEGSANALAAPPNAPPLPAAVPGEPLPPGSGSPRPLESLLEMAALAAPFVAVLFFWFALARRRAALTDPSRSLRQAHQRAAAGVRRLREAGPQGLAPLAENERAALRALLLSWQTDAAILWKLGAAAPTAGALPDSAWARLWEEAETALYSRSCALPADWPGRADEALASHPPPRFAGKQLFLRRNLFPFFLLLLCAGSAAPIQASDPGSAYRQGDFGGAEAGWRAGRSNDAAVRYDLSLALAQQKRWQESAGQATAAFVQSPGTPEIRRQFALACEKAGFAPGSLSAFLSPGPLHWLAAHASPAEWQRVLIAGAWLAAIAVCLALAGAYSPNRNRRSSIAVLSVFLLAAAAILLSLASRRCYSEAAGDDAVIVWKTGSLRSVPTEADTVQATAPLAAGNLARADRTFLGWAHLLFANGESGWVRREDLVYLWR